ncbi:taurine catabolism dioxygenase [Stagonosporopsis vannaccii]|nr:taurine catabolism dioxygenase [Stagonosporopsis vannaccii]
MATSVENFKTVELDGQQRTSSFGYADDQLFPLALQTAADWKPDLEEAVTHLESLSKTGTIFELVQRHGGALLIRGLPIKTAEDYSRIAHAFGFAPHEEVGRPPIRTVLARNVKTANEGPPTLPIWPHNEYGWSTHNPAWLTFSCLQVPDSGGATPLISSIGLAHKLAILAPTFYQHLLEKGVRYVYRYGRTQVTSTTGASIFAAYGQHVLDSDDETTLRTKIEAEVKRHSDIFHWHDDGSLSVTHIVPIIRRHVATDLTTWFGNLTSAYGRSRHHGATQPPFRGDDGSYHPLPTYGDGSAIATGDLEFALRLAEEMQVDLKWQRGDVVLIDNYAVMHSRKPWKGERVVLAALWDQEGRVGDFEEWKRRLER